jgi:hypothetical protein
VILSLFHIGRDYNITPKQISGDLYFNDTLVISQGAYVGDPAWPAAVASLKGGSVTELCASVGGGYPVIDFETIKVIYDAGQTFQNTNLQRTFKTFRSVFPDVTVIDMDCEETYDLPSFVAFCQMLVDLGFCLSFCPYQGESFWTKALSALQSSVDGPVHWWNLQCYSGGYGNDPKTWADAISAAIPGFETDGFIVPGFDAASGPAGVQSSLSQFQGEPSIGGAFIWTWDDMVKAGIPAAAYATAIRNAL